MKELVAIAMLSIVGVLFGVFFVILGNYIGRVLS
jgi:hypothetical protein